MSTEPYTPDEVELRDAYAQVMEEHSGEYHDQARADAERGIAKIKAEARISAWKEVSEFMRSQVSDDESVRHAAHLAATVIYFRASQIEEEA